MKIVIAILIFALIIPNTLFSQVLSSGKQFYLRGSIGYCKQALGDINDWINSDEQYFQSSGVPVEWDELGLALGFEGEFGYRITKIITISLGVNYQENSVVNSYTDYSGMISDDIKLSILDVTGNVSIFIPNTNGLFLGADAGIGFGGYDNDFKLQIYGDPSSSYSAITQANGTGFVGGIFFGYELNFISGPLLFGKLGYRYRNLGEFEGDIYSPQWGSFSGIIKNAADQPIDFDYSGVYLLVGFGFSFGKSL